MFSPLSSRECTGNCKECPAALRLVCPNSAFSPVAEAVLGLQRMKRFFDRARKTLNLRGVKDEPYRGFKPMENEVLDRITGTSDS